jgi:plastocyanin
MRNVLLLLLLVVLMLGAAGCSQPSPPATPAPVTTVAKVVHTVTTPQLVTTRPTLFVVGTPVSGPSVSDNTVTIEDDLSFDPQVITIKAGDTVRWVNLDARTHRIKFADPSFSTFLLSSGQSFSQKFVQPGSYDYSDLIFLSMHGTVKVG